MKYLIWFFWFFVVLLLFLATVFAAATIAENDAKERVSDPVLTLLKSVLDLLADMERTA